MAGQAASASDAHTRRVTEGCSVGWALTPAFSGFFAKKPRMSLPEVDMCGSGSVAGRREAGPPPADWARDTWHMKRTRDLSSDSYLRDEGAGEFVGERAQQLLAGTVATTK